MVTHEHDIAQMTKRIVHMKNRLTMDHIQVNEVKAFLYVCY
jgi:putative ABC transport system ATP-binding protein